MSSQGHEDAILERLFATIGTTNKIAVEFGARDGVGNSNTHRLRTRHGWTAVLFDSHPQGPDVHQVHLTAENINATFAEHGVPADFDLLSIDVDGNDFHLWKALTGYTPRVVVIEYNSSFRPDQRVVMPYNPDHRWDRSLYYGASAAALVKLGTEKGYRLVAVEPRTNLFFAREAALVDPDGWVVPIPPLDPWDYAPTTRAWEVY